MIHRERERERERERGGREERNDEDKIKLKHSSILRLKNMTVVPQIVCLFYFNIYDIELKNCQIFISWTPPVSCFK